MALLPSGFALPPLPYLLLLLAGLAAVGWAFSRRQPAVTERRILALAPWMVVGSALHALYVLDALPASIRPLAGTPAVYLSVAVVAGGVWLLADELETGVTQPLAATGVLALTGVSIAAVLVGLARGGLQIVFPVAATIVAAILAVSAWIGLQRLYAPVTVTGYAGLLAVFAHALDGVSTAVAVDIFGYTERTPLSRFILEFAADLPTADLLGAGWLFVLVKLLLACAIVSFMAGYVREDPREGYLLLGFVAAVGLGPGAHNLVLFMIG